jgi:hypothetical protein
LGKFGPGHKDIGNFEGGDIGEAGGVCDIEGVETVAADTEGTELGEGTADEGYVFELFETVAGDVKFLDVWWC